MLKGLSIFLPAYNEEKNIEKCVNSALKNAKKCAKAYEVIVVLYEGSTDRTREIVEGMTKKHNALKLVMQPKKDKGYGEALRLGIINSKFEYIFYTDADNQFDIDEIDKLLPFISEYDIVTGYRKSRKDQFMRLVAAWTYNLLLNTFFGINLKDVDCPFKIYKRKIFDDFTIKCKTGMADAEIIAKAQRLGYRVKELPVVHFSRQYGEAVFQSNTGLIKPKVVTDLLKDMGKLRKEFNRREWKKINQ